MKKATGYILGLICLVLFSFSATAGVCDSYTGSNENDQDYSVWASTIKSHLYVCSDGKLMRVQYITSDNKILIEYYDSSLNLVSQKTVSPDFSVFGGFYAVGDNYFVLTGQTNPSESSAVTCFAVTKYDKNWNRIAVAELKNCNTTEPFRAGSARFSHSGNYLLIRTCHEMYKSEDGYNHQANVTIQLDMNSMKITDSYTGVMNSSYGYVSHSFNQFIKVDNDKIVALDHGDAYPRSIVLIGYKTSVSSGKFTPSYSKQCTVTDMLSISGQIGNNRTDCSVGGFEVTSSGYLAALNSINQGSASTVRNIYLSYYDKNSASVQLRQLTYYTESGVSTPHLVKINENKFIVLWYFGGKVYCCETDGKGNMKGSVMSLEGSLSDCQPVVYGGKLIWYVWNGNKFDFYSINPSDLSQHSIKSYTYGHNYSLASVNGVNVSLKCSKCGGTITGKVPSDFRLWWQDLSDNSGGYTWYSSQIASSYHVGDKVKLSVDYTSADLNEYEIVSDDETVAKIMCQDGYYSVSALKNGTAKITIRSKYNPDIKQVYTFKVSHKWTVKESVAATCTKEGKEVKVCSVCSETVTETVAKKEHSMSGYTVTKEATCKATGIKKATCSVCGYYNTVEIPKKDHDKKITIEAEAATCTKSGKTEGKKCSGCGTVTQAQQTVDALGHNLGSYKVTKAPTCTAKGEETAKCTRCTYTKTRDVDKVAHTEVKVSGTAATCTKQGKTDGKKCSVCGKITIEQESIAALGHNLGSYKITKAPTCTAKGEETAKCTRCTYTKTRDVEKVAHTEVKVSGTAATCTKQGKTDGKKCSVCGKITAEQESIAALGHNLGSYKITKAPTCTAKGEETAKCTRCTYTKTRDVDKAAHTEVKVSGTAATCTKQGKTDGKKCSVCGKITVEQESIAALGHNLGSYKVTKAPTCTAKGEETATCTRCTYTKTRDVDKVAHTEVKVSGTAATCTKQGKTDGKKCSVCDKVTVEQETIPALGHNLSEYKITKEPTCTAKGVKTGECTRCSYTVNQDIDKIPHTEVTVTGMAPTCTKQGKTDGKKCSVCDKVTAEQESIPALGHNLSKYKITKEPTCTAKGVKTGECTRCSYTVNQDIDKIPHTEVTVTGMAPTCTKQGKTDGKKCSVCDKVTAEQESIPALGHNLSKYKITKEPTCTAKGVKTGECTRCSYTVNQDIDKTPHTEVTLKAVKATCTKSGKTAGKKCSVCDKIILAQQTVAALGHKEKVKVITTATTQANGKISTVCETCNKNLGEQRVYRISSITLSSTEYVYDGKTKTPTVRVVDYNKDTLVKDKDYTVTYEKSRKNIGKYSAKIKFIGKYSGSKTLYYEILPGATSKITATQSTSAVSLKWSAVSGANGYRVYQYDSKTAEYKQIANLKNTTEYKVTKLKAGTNYKFAVKAYYKNADGKVYLSKSQKAISTATKLAVPTVSLKSAGKSAEISWKKCTGADGYQVYYSTSKDGTYKKLTSTSALSFKKTGLTKGKNYYFKVRAYKKISSGTIYSDFSKAQSIKIK